MSYPLIFNSATVLKPFRRSATYNTMVQQFQTGAEQRYPTRGCLMEFEFPYSQLVKADKEQFRALVASTKGQQSVSTSLSIGSITYSNLTLTTDVFQATEAKTTQYGLTLPFRQVKPQSVTAATPSGTPAYPVLASGAMSMRPFVQAQRYGTLVSDQPTGERYTWAFFGAGLTGFPSRGLLAWTLSYPMLSDTDLATLEAWFHYAQGRLNPFNFSDEPSATSATSATVGTGSFTFTTQSGLTYATGELIRFQSGTAIMDGSISAYSGTTLSVTITTISGSGTYSAWNISRTYPTVRFDIDSFEINYQSWQETAVTVKLAEFYDPAMSAAAGY